MQKISLQKRSFFNSIGLDTNNLPPELQIKSNSMQTKLPKESVKFLTQKDWTIPQEKAFRLKNLFGTDNADFDNKTWIEIFDNNAVAVREASDYKVTFYASCCNGANGYLPTPPSYDWEITYESRTTKFPKGTAEIVQQELTDMLDELYAQTGKTPAEKPEGYLQPEFVPKSDGVVYQIPHPGDMSAIKAVQNSFYAIQLQNEKGVKNCLVKDVELAKQILQKETVTLLFDEQNVIVGIAD